MGECTIDICSSSQCTHSIDCDACGATACDDSDPCTIDTCSNTDGCSHDFSCAMCGQPEKEKTVVKVTTDTYYSETSRRVLGRDGSIVISKDSYPSTNSFEDNYCLAEGSYTFTIYDSWGDGICCSWGSGSYEVLVNGDSVASGGEFTDEESKEFEVTASPTTPVTAPTTTAPVTAPTSPSPPTGGSTPYPTESPPTPYPTESPPTPYPTEVPPTPHPVHPPPTPYPFSAPVSAPTPHPTGRAPTPWPTHTPPTPHPTGTPPTMEA